MVVEGLVSHPSSFGPQVTVDRLISSVTDRGMVVVARIDHSAAAAEAGLQLRWSEVLIFGNPRAGTPLMQLAPTMAIDLPLRAFVWQDADQQTWLSYNDPSRLAERHGINAGENDIVRAMSDALRAISRDVVGP